MYLFILCGNAQPCNGKKETERYPGFSTLHVKRLQEECLILRKLNLLFSPGVVEPEIGTGACRHCRWECGKEPPILVLEIQGSTFVNILSLP